MWCMCMITASSRGKRLLLLQVDFNSLIHLAILPSGIARQRGHGRAYIFC